MKVTLTEDSRLNALEIRFSGSLFRNRPDHNRVFRLLKTHRFEYWQKPVSAYVGKDTPQTRQMYEEIKTILNAEEKRLKSL